MIDLSQWRASIGEWNSHCTSYCCLSSSPNKISAVGDCLGALAVLCGCQVMMSLLSVVLGLRLILMLSGDIELNPGPGQPPDLDDVFHLLKSYSVDWQDIGRALQVNKKHRDELFSQGVMKSNDSKLEDVLDRWIESQCSEVSWDHLIEVLQDEQMADTVSKIKEYLLNNDKAKQKYQWKDESVFTNDDQPSAGHSLPPCLTSYSGLLKDKYKDQPIISRAEWPPKVGKDYYGRLLLLEKVRRDTETEQHKIWNTMRGNIDVLPKVTQSQLVDITDVFKPHSSAIVLIDGPPGVGKTTFCRKLLNMWGNEQLPTDQQQRYTVVLYCSLRDKRITKANTLTDIMKSCYANRDIEKVSEYIDEHDGDGLLIIFDGWDELSMEHRESSLAVKFVRREVLLKCTVIVTSRSYASESIMELSEKFRHFEVIGFGETEVHKVIEESFHDDGSQATNLLKELESQTNVKSLCYIPLVCSMVILIYKNLKHLPSRLTELYEKFILHAVKRHVKNSSTISTDPKQIRSLNQLPPCITTSFNKLCHFAYLSLKENNPRMTFSLPELQDALDVSVVEGYIGLMTTVSVYDEELYQFPHLTIQEFLAAWWIANNDGMDVKEFEEHFENDHFRLCLRFVAGLTGLKNEKFKKMKYFNIQLDLRCTIDDELDYAIRGSGCKVLISTDIPQRQLYLLYESNNTDLCKHMANTFIDSSFCFQRFCERPNSLDAICLLFFLHSSGITWNKIHLRIDDTNYPLPRLIMADVSTDVIECKQLIIEYGGVNRETEGFLDPGFVFFGKVVRVFSSDNIYCNFNRCYCLTETLITLLKIPQVKNINVFSAKQDDSFVNVESLSVIEKLLETTMTLEDLKVNILNSSKGDAIILAVTDGVIRNKSIKSLTLCNLSITNNRKDTATVDYSAAVSRHFKQLLKLNMTMDEMVTKHLPIYDISEIHAPLQSMQCSWLKPTEIESVLARCQHLQSLTIDVDKFPQPVRIPIANLFNHLPKLRKLSIESLGGDSELWVELFTILQTNQTLEELIMHDKPEVINDEVLLSLKHCLILNKSMKHLDMLATKFQTHLLLAFTEGLSSNKSIEQLSLGWIDITTNEGRSVLKAVFKMENLTSLTLKLMIGKIDGADFNLYIAITCFLLQNSHIKKLIIRTLTTDMPYSEELHHLKDLLYFLIKTIYEHPTLEYVYLSLISPEDDGGVLASSYFLKILAEQYLYKNQISNCINPRKKVPPLIEIFV